MGRLLVRALVDVRHGSYPARASGFSAPLAHVARHRGLALWLFRDLDEQLRRVLVARINCEGPLRVISSLVELLE